MNQRQVFKSSGVFAESSRRGENQTSVCNHSDGVALLLLEAKTKLSKKKSDLLTDKQLLVKYVKIMISMFFPFSLGRRTAKIITIAAATSLFSSPALSIPVSNSAEFVSYLNSDQNWGNGYKFKFNWVDDCFKKRGSNGRVRAFVCTNGVVRRTSPTGVTSNCRVSVVRVNKKGKLKLTTENCNYN